VREGTEVDSWDAADEKLDKKTKGKNAVEGGQTRDYVVGTVDAPDAEEGEGAAAGVAGEDELEAVANQARRHGDGRQQQQQHAIVAHAPAGVFGKRESRTGVDHTSNQQKKKKACECEIVGQNKASTEEKEEGTDLPDLTTLQQEQTEQTEQTEQLGDKQEATIADYIDPFVLDSSRAAVDNGFAIDADPFGAECVASTTGDGAATGRHDFASGDNDVSVGDNDFAPVEIAVVSAASGGSCGNATSATTIDGTFAGSVVDFGAGRANTFGVDDPMSVRSTDTTHTTMEEGEESAFEDGSSQKDLATPRRAEAELPTGTGTRMTEAAFADNAFASDPFAADGPFGV
jgi:hypothetical protein